MTDEAFNIQDFPSTIPVFPLPGVIMLPGSNLPLNVFEPRYLQMVKDVRANHGLIGMIQPRDGEDTSAVPPVYGVGGIGHITDYAETQDGRNIIRLTGLCRFAVKEELQVMTPYRQVQPDWVPFAADLAEGDASPPINRPELMAALQAYLEQKGLDADYDGINTAPDKVLINTLSMIIPFGVPEKQALLEAMGTTERAEVLKSLLVMMTSATLADVPTQPS